MAKVNLTEKLSKKVTLNKHVALPKDRYSLVCIKEEYGLSKSSNNPMVTRTFEFVTDSADMPDGSKLLLAGSQITKYYTLKSDGTQKNSAADATAMCLDTFKEDTMKCAPEAQIDWAEFDDTNPPLVLQGLTVDALCGDEAQVERKAPAPGKKVGDPIKDPVTGKPIQTHQAKILEFYAPSVSKVNVAY